MPKTPTPEPLALQPDASCTIWRGRKSERLEVPDFETSPEQLAKFFAAICDPAVTKVVLERRSTSAKITVRR